MDLKADNKTRLLYNSNSRSVIWYNTRTMHIVQVSINIVMGIYMCRVSAVTKVELGSANKLAMFYLTRGTINAHDG